MDANFDELVDKIRKDRNLTEKMVPGFKKGNANRDARFLILLESPGPKAVESGEVSTTNDDPTASELLSQLGAVHIDVQKDCAIWNVVPWALTEGNRFRSPKSDELAAAFEYLGDLVRPMKHLQAILLMGSSARRAHVKLSAITKARILSCHHPSRRAMSDNRRKENIEVMKNMVER